MNLYMSHRFFPLLHELILMKYNAAKHLQYCGNDIFQPWNERGVAGLCEEATDRKLQKILSPHEIISTAFVINGPKQKAMDLKWSQLWSILPVSIAFWYKMNAKRYYFLWQKKKGEGESKSQEPCGWTQGKTHTRRKMAIFTVIP